MLDVFFVSCGGATSSSGTGSASEMLVFRFAGGSDIFRATGRLENTAAAPSKLYEPGTATVMMGISRFNAVQISKIAYGSVGTASNRIVSVDNRMH
eukprot:3536644-Prymnesium_polylepis.2